MKKQILAKQRKNKGITLIALVITIIVLLILAGISIATLTGENGMLSKANTATEESKKAEIKERLELAILDIQAEEIEKGNIFTIESIIQKLPSKVENTTISANGNLAQGNSEGYDIYINEQYHVILGKIEAEEDDEYEYEYIDDGLIILYDGEHNTASGHDAKAKTWTNLAKQTKGQNDGTLMNIDFNDKSGWTDNALVFDGIDDWMAIKELNYPNITIEAVMEYITSTGNEEKAIVSNLEKGGYSLLRSPGQYNRFQVYINDQYYNVSSPNKMETNHKYSLSGNYDGKVLTLSENGKITTVTKEGSIKYPDSNTILALGTNPKGTEPQNSYLNGKIYSIRIYNRALTEAEIQRNYEVDKERFGL